MKTVMSETLNSVNSPYKSIRENAELRLKFLQEEYKSSFGEYSAEHIIPLKEDTIKYAEMNIGELIKGLENLKGAGATKIQIDGTLLCKEDGNTVIMTNKAQM